MGIKSGDFEYDLKRPLDYKFEGNTETSNMVLLKEPGMEHIKFYLRLKQMITRSQMELATQAGELVKMQEAIGEVVKPISEDVDKIEDDAQEVYDVFLLGLEASEKVDMGTFIGTFEKMVTARAKKTICMVDNKVAMTGALWGNLHPDDALEMAVRWCAFFGTPSQEGQRTTSDQQSESHTEPTEV